MKLNKSLVKLVKKTQITDTVFEMVFESSEEITFIPGQYLAMDIDEHQKRMYSILGVDGNRVTLVIDIKPGGDASKLFEKVEVGFETKIMYPMGDFMLQSNDNPKLFIASGTGIVPLIAMIKQEMKKDLKYKPVLLWGLRYDKDNYLERYLETEAGNGLTAKLCITRPSGNYDGYVGRVTSAIKELSFELPLQQYEVYICGSKEMVKSTDEDLKNLGVDKIFMERY